MTYKKIVYSVLFLTSLFGQSYSQAASTCSFVSTSTIGGQDSSYVFTFTPSTQLTSSGSIALSFDQPWTLWNFPQGGLTCTASQGFTSMGQQPCSLQTSPDGKIQVVLLNAAASSSYYEFTLHHIKNPFGPAPFGCGLFGQDPQSPIAQGPAVPVENFEAGPVNVYLTNMTFQLSSSAKFDKNHAIVIQFPSWWSAFAGHGAPLQAPSFIKGCTTADCNLDQFKAAGKTIFRTQGFQDLNATVQYVLNQGIESLIIKPNLTNASAPNTQLEINLPKAIFNPPTSFFAYDFVVQHFDNLGNILATSENSYNQPYLTTSVPAPLNTTQNITVNPQPGASGAVYQINITSNLPLGMDCYIAIYHNNLTWDPQTFGVQANGGLNLQIASANSTVILLRSGEWTATQLATINLSGIINPTIRGSQYRVVMLDAGLNPIAVSQPFILEPANPTKGPGSCQVVGVWDSNAIGFTGKYNIRYIPGDTTNSTGILTLKFNSTQWPVTATMPKVSNFSSIAPGFSNTSVVSTKINTISNTLSQYQIDISNIQNSFNFDFVLVNMVNPNQIIANPTSTSAPPVFIGTCQITDKNNVVKDVTNMTIGAPNLWAPPILNTNIITPNPLRNGQIIDGVFNMSVPKPITPNSSFVISLPNRFSVYPDEPGQSYLTNCSPNQCDFSNFVAQLVDATNKTYNLTASSVSGSPAISLKYINTTVQVPGTYRLVLKNSLIAPPTQDSQDQFNITLFDVNNTIVATTDGAFVRPVIRSQAPNMFMTTSYARISAASDKTPGAQDVIYEFNLQLTNPIPEGGRVEIQVPFQLDTSSIQLVPDTTGVAFTPDVTQFGQNGLIVLVINDFTPPNSAVKFTLTGVVNPIQKGNNYTVSTFDLHNNVLDRQNFLINPANDATTSGCILTDVSVNRYGTPGVAYFFQYSPKDTFSTNGTVVFTFNNKFFDIPQSIQCFSANYALAPNSTCSISRNTSGIVQVKIQNALPFLQFTLSVTNLTNPSSIINPQESLGLCQLVQGNQIIDNTTLTSTGPIFQTAGINPALNTPDRGIAGSNGTAIFSLQTSVGLSSTDTIQITLPYRTEYYTNVPAAESTTFIGQTSTFTITQIQIQGVSLSTTTAMAMPTLTTLNTIPATRNITVNTQAGTTTYVVIPKFNTGVTYISNGMFTFYNVTVTNWKNAPSVEPHQYKITINDAAGNVKATSEFSTYPASIMTMNGQFNPANSNASMVGDITGPGMAGATYKFNLVTINPIPVQGAIVIQAQGAIVVQPILTVNTQALVGHLTLSYDDVSGNITITTDTYIFAGTTVSFQIVGFTNPQLTYGNEYRVNSQDQDGVLIDRTSFMLNPRSSTPQCILQSLTSNNSMIPPFVAGQPASYSFTYTTQNASTAGAKIQVALSGKIFGSASTVSCSSTNGFSSVAPTCTATIEATTGRLLLAVTGATTGSKQFDFVVNGVINPSSTQLVPSETVFGQCQIVDSTNKVLDSSIVQKGAWTWMPFPLAPQAISIRTSNGMNGAISDLMVNFTTPSALLNNTVFKFQFPLQYSYYQYFSPTEVYPMTSSIFNLSQTSQPVFNFKQALACQLPGSTTKVTPTKVIGNAISQDAFDMDQNQLDAFTLTLNTATIPAGSLCQFTLGNFINNAPSASEQLEIAFFAFDAQQNIIAIKDSILFNTQQPNRLNVTARMIGSNTPLATGVKYSFTVNTTNMIPSDGSIQIALPPGVQIVNPQLDQTSDNFFNYNTISFQAPYLNVDVTQRIPALSNFTIVISGFNNGNGTNGFNFNVSSFDHQLNPIDAGGVALNPQIPKAACNLTQVNDPTTGVTTNYRFQYVLPAPINSTNAAITIGLNKNIWTGISTTTIVDCSPVSPTFTQIQCSLNFDSQGNPVITAMGAALGQNVFEFIVYNIPNPSSTQQVPTEKSFGVCGIKDSITNQVYMNMNLTNNLFFYPAMLMDGQIQTSSPINGAIIDATISWTNTADLPLNFTILASLMRKNMQHFLSNGGLAVTQLTESSIVNCSATSCVPKINTTALICQDTTQTNVITVPLIKVSTVYGSASQPMDNITFSPQTNQVIPKGFMCTFTVQKAFYNPTSSSPYAIVPFALRDKNNNFIAQGAGLINNDQPAPIQLSGAQTNNTLNNGTYQFNFTTANPIPVGGSIKITYPITTTLPTPGLSASSVVGLIFVPIDPTVETNVLYIFNNKTYIAANTKISISISGFTFVNTYTGNNFIVTTYDVLRSNIDSGSSNINPIAPVLVQFWKYTSTSTTAANDQLTFSCPVSYNASAANIILTFPVGYTFSGTACTGFGALKASINTATTCAWTATTRTIVFPSGTGMIDADFSIDTKFSNLMLPAQGTIPAFNIAVTQGPLTVCSGNYVPSRT